MPYKQYKQLQNDNDGIAWIENGQVYVKKEGKNGMPPMINPCEEVKLLINGTECNHLTTVNESDTILLEPVVIKSGMQLDAEISDDRLKCFLVFTPERLVGHAIKNTKPANKIDIQAEQIIIETRKTDCQKIVDYLKSVNIVHGIRMDVIKQICENNKPGKFLIAEGAPPEEPIDDRIEYFFNDSDSRKLPLNENAKGSIDYKDILQYETVTQGQIIARLYKGEAGKNGIAVTGEILAPRPQKELIIVPTFSIHYDEKTGDIKAVKTGRPYRQEKGNAIAFYIYDCVVLDEVSMRTGNIKFKGDIEIKNNVCESMEVIAKQNVLVRGNVEFASIYAGNNITIKGTAISSNINAALNDVTAKDPSPLIDKLMDGINKLILNVNQMSEKDMDAEQINKLIWSLLNTKNKDLPAIIYEVLYSLRRGNYDIEDEFILSLMKKTSSLMGNYTKIDHIEYLYDLINELKTIFSGKKNIPRGDVALNSITNCEVSALGSIMIQGKGCVNSRIYSKARVIVKGYVRGGQIRAEKGIEVNVAGSERGSRILLAVPDDGYIHIRTAYADTTIKVGGLSHTFYSEKKMVRARIENGKLVF